VYYDRQMWKPYVRVADRRRNAARLVKKLRKQGRTITPIEIEGRKIARSFWGAAWCDNLESYSDFSNRLPRGRTYVRNGSVIDLQIEPGKVTALVSGSDIYDVAIDIKRLSKKRWNGIVADCSGRIDSLVDLLAGEFSTGVMQLLARPDTGLFPAPREIGLECSCPDWAAMCKHVAAALYGVGARLDKAPELLFRMRQVEATELVAEVGTADAIARLTTDGGGGNVLADAELSDLFGIELDDDDAPSTGAQPVRGGPATGAAKTKRRKRGANKVGKRTAKVSPRKQSGRPKTLSARELIERGVPRSTFQNWVRDGVLRKTKKRGVYATTAETEERIRRALARKRSGSIPRSDRERS